ncbi:LuxR family maltose regulon positive regulatory protein [Actinomadura pelletieri DSM 43383]|uniref:LuxR family maltose regulon positive regulatory protein n=1 Tax=Actinomadura pelletieri DSM 43383 TaxID=1120940 RepID=A0A495QGN9_9ACTN|nr:LuxR C-terminal-related transcriptional regulator [Actinomadura pelletieri]RKS71034.1 LuxR family maltose regulon positive regulatory protein [Actinomadura pelletieri DSM 43383]
MSEAPAQDPASDRGRPTAPAPIAKAKVRVPGRRGWFITRYRLTERLDQGTRGPLTVVTGPPGAGKTVAAASWATVGDSPGPVAWVSLDEADHEPHAFWSLVVAALEQAGVTDLPRLAEQGHDMFCARLMFALSGRAAPVVLVLDDFRPPVGSEIARDVARVLKGAGPVLRLVLISRTDPPFPLHRYRLTGELVEIRSADLAFDDGETRTLLAHHGVSAAPESISALCERTEGWAAGLRLAAMTMEGHPDPDGFAAEFAGDDHAVVDYLVAEVLNAQAAAVRRLLLRLSVVERFDAELATELAGPDAGELFAGLVRENAFVLPVEHGWYRFHSVLGAALNLTLRQECPSDVPLLHRRAAEWFSRIGALEEAARHAVLAGDPAYASRLVVDGLAIGRVLGLSDGRVLAPLLNDLPERALAEAAEPEPHLVAAAVSVDRGDDAGRAVHLTRAERLLADLPDDQAIPARLAAGLIRLVAACPERQRDLRDLVHDLDALLDTLPHGSRRDLPELSALVGYAHGLLELRAGRPARAEEELRRALPAAETGGDLQRRRCLGALALAEALQGGLGQASRVTAAAARLPEVSTDPAGRRVAAVHLACAWVALEDVRLDEARTELDKARVANAESPDALLSALHDLLTARLDVAAGHPDRALSVLDAIGGDAASTPWFRRRMRLVEAEAHLAGDAPVQAKRAARAVGGAEGAVTLARVHLHERLLEAASRTVRPVLREPSAPAAVRVEAWLLDACLAYREDDPSRGRRSLERALRLGERERIGLPFARARNWLLPTLRQDPELTRPHRRFLRPLGLGGSLDEPDADPAVVARLSERELEVLSLLSRMLTTDEIATEMYISVNTVKTHLKNIYRKLAVTRRGEAVRRARRYRLL